MIVRQGFAMLAVGWYHLTFQIPAIRYYLAIY